MNRFICDVELVIFINTIEREIRGRDHIVVELQPI